MSSSLADLRKIFYGGGSDAEYQWLLDAQAAGIDAAGLLDGSLFVDAIADQPMVVDSTDIDMQDSAGDLQPVLRHRLANMNANWLGITNTVVQSLIGVGHTIPANGLPTNSAFNIRVAGTMKNNSGGAATQTLRLRGNVGGVFQTFATQAVVLPNSATNRPYVWNISGSIGTFGNIYIHLTDHLVVAIDGANPRIEQMGNSTLATIIDPTVSRIWEVTVQHSVAHANMHTLATTAIMETTRAAA